ncbi:hypothetical protein KZZ52_39695 [Dactylosporangium sp. AC04546]|uniref:hypothetical protein n=1 Tax=Dactylosporangium sp. AC04546 TaxID=2862460 RepID=UPI001EDDD429|nr:hypothetical protein [Dactylosporangium sp. AC04546]WVK80073.1 hypothetical protein KZZ52_39695 [Dactylosporangium sp. AC04546]
MRVSLTGRWSVELEGAWERRRQRHAQLPVTWTGPDGLLQVLDVATAGSRDVSELDLLAMLADEVPPGATGRLGEAGRDGIGHRAAWCFPDALWGYTFVDGRYVRTVFVSVDADLRWAFSAWRSIRYTP